MPLYFSVSCLSIKQLQLWSGGLGRSVMALKNDQVSSLFTSVALLLLILSCHSLFKWTVRGRLIAESCSWWKIIKLSIFNITLGFHS